jgi:mannitol-1-/sugar-/sorbitol-6-phosphatase
MIFDGKLSGAGKAVAACLFDLDGTLVDTEPMWVRALRLSLNEISCPLAQETADELVYGRSWLDIYADLCRMFPAKCVDRPALEAWIDFHFAILKKEGSVVIDSSVELLIKLAQEMPVAIVSGSSRKMVGEWIEQMRIGPRIQFYLGCDDYARGKPDPGCYIMAGERLGVDNASCLVFEDSTAGVRAAKAAGMNCIALKRAGARQQDLGSADLVLDDLAKLECGGLSLNPPVFRRR